jgi:hypothetical protein
MQSNHVTTLSIAVKVFHPSMKLYSGCYVKGLFEISKFFYVLQSIPAKWVAIDFSGPGGFLDFSFSAFSV